MTGSSCKVWWLRRISRRRWRGCHGGRAVPVAAGHCGAWPIEIPPQAAGARSREEGLAGSAEELHFAAADEIAESDSAKIAAVAKKAGKMNKAGVASPVKDFYLTNPIARASAVMAECSALARNNFKVAAE